MDHTTLSDFELQKCTFDFCVNSSALINITIRPTKIELDQIFRDQERST